MLPHYLGKIGVLHSMFHCKCVCENERSAFHLNSAKLRLLRQRMDKLVPSTYSNFSDVILCYWVNYNFYSVEI